jgi:hypothetical protein
MTGASAVGGTCVTVAVCPWIVNIPVRGLVPVSGAAVNVALPFPVPLPELIVNQLASLLAVHAQPPPAVTVTPPLPPAAPTVCDVGEIA